MCLYEFQSSKTVGTNVPNMSDEAIDAAMEKAPGVQLFLNHDSVAIHVAPPRISINTAIAGQDEFLKFRRPKISILNDHCLRVDMKNPRDYRRVMEIMFYGPIEEAKLYLPLFNNQNG